MERAPERPAYRCGRAHLRRGGKSLRELEWCHGGRKLGGARRTASRQIEVVGIDSPRWVRDGHGGAQHRSLCRRASQRPFGASTRHLQGRRAGRISCVVGPQLRDEICYLYLTRPRRSVYASACVEEKFSELRLNGVLRSSAYMRAEDRAMLLLGNSWSRPK